MHAHSSDSDQAHQSSNSTSSTKVVADPLDLENWYDHLKDTTFRTQFLELSREEAQCMVDEYNDDRYKDSSAQKKITPEKRAVLLGLEQRLQTIITGFGGKAFVRLSTRSPKDVALRRPKTKQIFDHELKDLKKDVHNEEVAQVIAIIRCASRAMASESGTEAMDFLCHSERAYQDLTIRLLRTDFSMKIIVREWVNILPEWEFRGFIHKNQFTALTQYYKACYVPGMYEKREEIQKRIFQLWESVRSRMPTDSYVADFAVTPEKVNLIELNDFAKTTSSSLFDWQKDTKVMHDGPFELRIVPSPIPGVKAMIASPLRKLVGWSDDEVQKAEIELAKYKESLEKKYHHHGHHSAHEEADQEGGCCTM